MNKQRNYIPELLFAVALAIVTVKVQRAASKPDFGRTFLMGRAWAVKRMADNQVSFWQDVAGRAATTYNGLKP